MQAEIAKAVRDPDLVRRFIEQAVELTASESADECTSFIRTQVEIFAKLLMQAGIKPE